MKATALATATTGVVAIVVVVVVVVTVVVGTIIVGVGVVELVSWMKARQVASPTGLGPCPYPSPASGGINPSPGPALSL